MKILCTDTEFKVAVNKSHLLEFKHRVRELSQIRGLSIFGDVTLSSVNVETLQWNLHWFCNSFMSFDNDICNLFNHTCKLFYLHFLTLCMSTRVYANVRMIYICMQIFLSAVVRFATSRWVCYYLGWDWDWVVIRLSGRVKRNKYFTWTWYWWWWWWWWE